MKNKKIVPEYNYSLKEPCKFRTYDSVIIGDARCHNCIDLISLSKTMVKCKSYGKELQDV